MDTPFTSDNRETPRSPRLAPLLPRAHAHRSSPCRFCSCVPPTSLPPFARSPLLRTGRTGVSTPGSVAAALLRPRARAHPHPSLPPPLSLPPYPYPTRVLFVLRAGRTGVCAPGALAAALLRPRACAHPH